MLALRTEKNAAEMLGVGFLLIMLLGITPNPLLSFHGAFMTGDAINVLHGLTGGVLLVAAQTHHGKMVTLLTGIFYVLIGILGYWVGSGGALGATIAPNHADTYLHLAMGIATIAVGVWEMPEGSRR